MGYYILSLLKISNTENGSFRGVRFVNKAVNHSGDLLLCNVTNIERWNIGDEDQSSIYIIHYYYSFVT